MARRKGKCYLVSFSDGSTLKIHAKTKGEIKYIAAEPSAVEKITVQRDNGYERKRV